MAVPDRSPLRGAAVPLAVTIAFQSLAAMAALTLPVLAPAAAGDVGVSAGYVGLYIALVYGASMASSVASGDLIRKLGAVRVSQICMGLCALGLGVGALGTVAAVACSALLIGAGYGPITPASSHILVRTTPPRLISLVFSLKQTGVPIGGALAGAILPGLVLLGGWRFAALAVGAGCLLTSALTAPTRGRFDDDVEPARRIGVHGVRRSLAIAIGEPAVRRLAACSFFYSTAQLCLVTFLVTYLSVGLGFSLVQAGLMLAIAQGAGICGRIAWGAVADRSGRPVAVLGWLGCGMALAAVLSTLLSVQWSPAAIAVVCAAFGATAIGWNGVFLAEVARQAPAGQAVEATGGVLFFTFCGVLVGPPLFAFIVENGGSYALAFGLLAVPTLLCGAFLLWHDRRARRAVPAHADGREPR